nr:uncharacterized protein LOC111422600 [Onthophagus taurus]
MIAVDIIFPEYTYRVVGVYLSPSGTADQLRSDAQLLCDELDDVLDTLNTIVVLGDFNCPKIDWDNLSAPGRDPDTPSRDCLILDLFCGLGLNQLIQSPTHKAGNILDLAFCNDDCVQDLQLCNGPFRSDHYLIKFHLLNESFVQSNREKFDFEKTDYDEVIANLSATNWRTFFLSCIDVEDMYNTFIRYLWFLIEVTTPLKHLESRGSISDFIKRITTDIESSNDPVETERLRAVLTKAVKRKRILLESRIAKSRNSKEIFSYVKKRITIKDNLSAIRRDDGSLATDDVEKAELLAKHFAKTYPSTVATDSEASSTPIEAYAPTRQAPQQINDVSVLPEDILKHLNHMELKLSTNPEGIPAYFYKKCGIDICIPLSYIFRRSLEDGAVPQLFQRAIVTPVHKKGAATEASNKRPVSLTVVPCKLLESIICEAIYNNANSQGLISNQQFAYRPGLDTTLQLLSTQCDWALFY